ncbi:tetratricopeptide repeat-containing sulfotransferase family protein [Magnetococcus sp. PR-3]|uniref:tetratricopeptide repeat-containing sulfotransferase family protein n=1 Tax=Magnetococcus sp. PR-3 TaxID=3120355 RepID=UPI002FCE0F9A
MRTEPLQQLQTLMAEHKWPQAWPLCQALLRKMPNHGQLLCMAGEINLQTNRPEHATPLLQRALQQLPDSSRVYNLLSRSLMAMGEQIVAGRIVHEGLSKDPESTPLRETLADLQVQQQAWPDAQRNYQLLLKQHPDHATFHRKLADVFRERHDFFSAEQHYKRALEQDDQSAATWHGLGQLALEQNRGAEAEQHFLRGRPLTNHTAIFDNSIGMARMADGRVTEALSAFKQGLETEPDAPLLQSNLANALRASGDLQATQTLFEQGVQQHPDNTFFVTGLAQMRHIRDPHDDLIQKMETMVVQPQMEPQTRINMYYILGRALDQAQAYDRAFAAFQQANGQRYHNQGPTDLHSNVALITHIRATFNQQGPGYGMVTQQNDPVVPIFIVGMFRSGSTLIEQMLGAHPHTATTGERSMVSRLLHKMPEQLATTVGFPDCFKHLQPSLANTMSQSYLAELRENCDAPKDPKVTHITDKLLFNFLYLGAIATLFPKARILHSVRNPMDTCLSIYFQNFTRGQRFMQSLEETGHYYRAYAQMMEYWQQVLPMPIHNVHYEKMVTNPEIEIKNILDFVGLPWHDACLRPHENRRSVQTASSQQVRKPIYQHAQHRWKNYEKHIKGLRQILNS